MANSWRISALAERHRALGSKLEDWSGMGTAWTYASDLADGDRKSNRMSTSMAHVPAHAAFGGYKKSGVGRETHKMMLDHYQQTKNLLVSYDINPLGFF